MNEGRMTIKDLRREYARRSLDEATADPDPIQQFRVWFDEALKAELLDANAMTLATVTPDGVPIARIVLLKDIVDGTLVFYTHYQSAKGKQLAEKPVASLLFFWAELERQVRMTGSVERVAADNSDDYFASRPRASQIAAAASHQSEEIPDRAALEARVAELEHEYDGKPVPRPPQWGGYRFTPERIEFWQGRPSRLHDRLLYTKTPNGWTRVRLAP
jgi:pyridoxamine 5'-phosphate oxidase